MPRKSGAFTPNPGRGQAERCASTWILSTTWPSGRRDWSFPCTFKLRGRMGKAGVTDWRGPKARLRLAGLGVSLTLHVLILGFIGLRHVTSPDLLVADASPPVYLELEPRPLVPGELARRPTVPSSLSTDTDPATRSENRSDLDERREDEDRPTVPSPRIAAPLPASPGLAPEGASARAAPNPDDRWSVRPADLRGAVARSLRLGAAGCRALDGQLPQGEQQICDERFNEAAGRARPIGPRTLNSSEARREEQFARAGEAAIDRYERLRAPMRSGVGVVGATPDCPGGNLRSTCPGAHLAPHFQHPENAPQGGRAGPR